MHNLTETLVLKGIAKYSKLMGHHLQASHGEVCVSHTMSHKLAHRSFHFQRKTHLRATRWSSEGPEEWKPFPRCYEAGKLENEKKMKKAHVLASPITNAICFLKIIRMFGIPVHIGLIFISSYIGIEHGTDTNSKSKCKY